jgi:isopentenyl phosphate kinase
MGRLSLVKLGGSLITDKRHEGRSRPEVIERLAGEIAELRQSAGEAWIVGHGSGSFGHYEAHRHRVHHGLESEDQLPGIAATQRRAADLHRLVVEALAAAGESPYSIAPSSCLVAAGGVPAELWLEPVTLALDSGLLPVVYGDVVMDREQGCAICSTETLFVSLVGALQGSGRQVGRVYWMGETEGVLDEEGGLIPELSPAAAESLLARIEGASGRDVTGGMRHRLATVVELCERGVGSWIGNGLEPGRLAQAIRGEVVPGTLVAP